MDSAAASLADEFLADLDSEDEFADQDDTQAVPSEVSAPVDAQGDEAMTDSTLEKETAFVARAEKLEDASKLLFDGRIVTLTAKIDAYRREADVSSATPATAMEKILAERQGGQERSQDNTSYSLIVECNSISVEIGEELARIHKLIQDLFGKRFYDLESLVVNPLDYIRVVQRLAPAERITYSRNIPLFDHFWIGVWCGATGAVVAKQTKRAPL
jgi:U4/U6 small nuclear ribonucleoprotein PRP31